MTYALLILAAAALYAAIAWRDLRHGVLILAAVLPSYLLRFQVGPVPMTLLEAFALTLIAIWAIKRATHVPPLDPSLGRRGNAFVLPAFFLLAAATVSVFVAPDTISALGIWKAYFVEPILVYFVVTDILQRDEKRKTKNEKQILAALGAGGLFVAVCAIAQSLTGWGIPAPWDVEGRVVSVFPYPNAVGLYLGPIIVIGVVESWSRGVVPCLPAGRESWKRAFWIGTTVLSLVAIALSQSEAAVVAVVATLLVAGLASRRFRAVSAGLVALAVMATLVFPPLRDKLTFNDFSGQVRRSQWSETIDMLRDRPLLGAGLNGYPAAMAPYHHADQYEIFQYPHTLVLNVWSELGLLGLVAFGVLGAWVIRFSFLVFRFSSNDLTKNEKRKTKNPALLALLAMTVHGLADVSYFKNDLAVMTWILIAVIAATPYAKHPSERP